MIFNKCRAAVHAGALSLRGLVTPLPAPTALTLASAQVQSTLGAAARLCIPESSAERQQVCTRRCFPSLHTTPERRSGICTHPPLSFEGCCSKVNYWPAETYIFLTASQESTSGRSATSTQQVVGLRRAVSWRYHGTRGVI